MWGVNAWEVSWTGGDREANRGGVHHVGRGKGADKEKFREGGTVSSEQPVKKEEGSEKHSSGKRENRKSFGESFTETAKEKTTLLRVKKKEEG